MGIARCLWRRRNRLASYTGETRNKTVPLTTYFTGTQGSQGTKDMRAEEVEALGSLEALRQKWQHDGKRLFFQA